MSTSKFEISQWFDQGVAKGATHMVVVCDTYDHEDYPVYVLPTEDVHAVEAQYRKASMQVVMEVYDLRADKNKQLDEDRSFNYGEP